MGSQSSSATVQKCDHYTEILMSKKERKLLVLIRGEKWHRNTLIKIIQRIFISYREASCSCCGPWQPQYLIYLHSSYAHCMLLIYASSQLGRKTTTYRVLLIREEVKYAHFNFEVKDGSYVAHSKGVNSCAMIHFLGLMELALHGQVNRGSIKAVALR